LACSMIDLSTDRHDPYTDEDIEYKNTPLTPSISPPSLKTVQPRPEPPRRERDYAKRRRYSDDKEQRSRKRDRYEPGTVHRQSQRH